MLVTNVCQYTEIQGNRLSSQTQNHTNTIT